MNIWDAILPGLMAGVVLGIFLIGLVKITRWGWSRGRDVGFFLYRMQGYFVALIAGYFSLFIIIVIPATAVMGNLISVFAVPALLVTLWFFKLAIFKQK